MRQNSWFALIVVAGLAAVMTPMILLAASGNGSGFDAVVHGIESRYHVRATRIPFMGLISGIAGIATHGGVHGLHVAEIENFEGPVDGAELNTLVEQRVGQGWQRMIRETSRDGGEQTLIFVRAEGDRIGMLVVDLDNREMNVVQMSMNPERLSDEIAHHHHGRQAESGDQEDASKNAGDQGKSDSE